MSNDSDLVTLLEREAERLKVTLPEGAAPALVGYLRHLLEANAHLNLTSITDPTEGVHKHLVDSVAALALPQLATLGDAEWVDVGSGGGLPGLALALARPRQRVALVEATGKKAGYLESATQALGLAGRVRVAAERAERLGQKAAWRGRAGAVFFKAVGSLPEILELGLPLIKVGGVLVALKGPKAADETAAAGKALRVLGGTVETTHIYTLGWQHDQRALVVVRKTSETPQAYPRRDGLPKNQPLV